MHICKVRPRLWWVAISSLWEYPAYGITSCNVDRHSSRMIGFCSQKPRARAGAEFEVYQIEAAHPLNPEQLPEASEIHRTIP